MDDTVSGYMDDEERKIEYDEKPQSRNKRTTKLESLSCWDEVKHMLETQVPVKDIVYHIREVRGEYREIKANSLRVTIYQWLQRNSDTLDDTRIPTQYLTLLNSVSERVDPLDALNMLFAIQVDRIMIDYIVEKKIKKSVSSNTNSLRLAMEMTKTMNHLALDKFKFKANLGSDSSQGAKETFEQIERVKQRYQERFGDKAAAVVLNPESRRKVYNALSKVRKGDTQPMLKLLKLNEEKLKQLEEQGIGKDDEQD